MPFVNFYKVWLLRCIAVARITQIAERLFKLLPKKSVIMALITPKLPLVMTDIFISYSHKDEAWKDALKKHLQVLQLHTKFGIWDDGQIELGGDWQVEIEQAIAQAKVVILLISSDFLTSEFATQQEIPKFLQRRTQEGLRIVPVIVKPCAWNTVPWLAKLKGAVKDNKPLSQYPLESFELDNAFSAIVNKVSDLLQERGVRQQESASSGTGSSSSISPPPMWPPNLKAIAVIMGVVIALTVLGVFIANLASSMSSEPQALELPPPSKPLATRLPFEPEMVSVPAGTFTMGCLPARDLISSFDSCKNADELPAHTVNVVAFQIGKYEVTFDEWDACERAKVCPHVDNKDISARGRHPVINVNMWDVKKYIDWLNQQTGKQYRLPTEAEWEYAARGGKEAAFPWGTNQISCDKARYGYRWNLECNTNSTAEVGSYPANGFGLYDMAGNVWEWVQDKHTLNYDVAPTQENIVLRGGGWMGYSGMRLRSAYRLNDLPGNRLDDAGFRLALD